MLERIVDKCWRELLEKSGVETCCEKVWKRVLERCVVEKCWGKNGLLVVFVEKAVAVDASCAR